MSDDPRLRDLIEYVPWPWDTSFDPFRGARSVVVLLGFPFDEGVRRNGGIGGANRGPEAFRAVVKKIGSLDNPELDISLSGIRVIDAGDVDPSLELEKAHTELATMVDGLIRLNCIPFVIGGGNDQSYANVSGLMSALPGKEYAVINVDAHLDVRPRKEGKIHSGSPFREMLEDSRFKGSFVEFAAHGNQCSRIHADYVRSKGGKILWFERDLDYGDKCLEHLRVLFKEFSDRIVFFSFDIDSICSSFCPGVSCPAMYGLSSALAFKMCFMAGSNPHVRIMDVSELNPFVESVRTPRLVAFMLYHFLLGVATRP